MRRFTFTPPEPRIAGYPDQMTATLDERYCDEDADVRHLRAAFGDANPNMPEHRGWAFQAIVDITDLPDWIEATVAGGYRSSRGSDGVSGPMMLVPVTEV